MTLTQSILVGIGWGGTARVANQILHISFLIILARLIDPDQFGILAMIIAVTGFAQVLADGGLNAALIYTQSTSDTHYSTAFSIQLIFGVVMAVLFFLSAPLIATFY